MERLIRENINAEKIVHELASFGASSCLVIPDSFRVQLAQEAASYSFAETRSISQPGKPNEVRQELDEFKNFPVDSQFLIFERELSEELASQFNRLKNYPFSTTLRWNSRTLQRHKDSTIGITPHVDGASVKNLIAVLNVSGSADFYTCDDRDKTNPRKIETIPGILVLMRAPGFRLLEGEQFHWVENIRGLRYTYGMRQRERSQVP